MKNLPDKITWQGRTLNFSGGAIIMGILNVTPDSFSDAGLYYDTDKAVAHGIQMAEQGAAVLDIGAESTRPGSQPVPAVEQIRRAMPVIDKLASKFDIPISIDTTDHNVAKAAMDAGASIINDITALASEKMTLLAAEKACPVILMHMQGTPQTMQENPTYTDVVQDVSTFLTQRAKYAESAGIKHDRIILDPGIGFGKTIAHNLQLLNQLDQICELGYRVLVGTSRKGFIGKITGRQAASDRDFGTAATVAHSIIKGASIIRVHNVAAMVDVAAVTNAILKTNA